MKTTLLALPLLLSMPLLPGAAAQAGTIGAPAVERIAPDRVAVTWTDADPVDLFVAERPDTAIADARPISAADRNGRHELAVAPTARPYLLLRDTRSGAVVRVAERVLPLQQSSNFRDIGGYPAAGGRHVRWGLIYRSGATALLTDRDVKEVQALGLTDMIDLRSNEERVLAPTRLDGIPYRAVGYSMAAVMAGTKGAPSNGGTVYRNFPVLLAPQLRIIFADLLGRKGPIAYNCSAGQDRTGFATAMILSALGVPRDTIVADYHLSTALRRPEFEMPKIDTVAQANNPTALFFARYQRDPAAAKPQPLKDADGTPFLAHAFAEIEAHWGSVDAYLAKEIGVGPKDIATLRAAYLE